MICVHLAVFPMFFQHPHPPEAHHILLSEIAGFQPGGFVTFQREKNMWFNHGLTIEFGRFFPLSSNFFPKIESTCVCDLDSSSLFYSCLTLDINWFDIFG